MYTPSTTVLKKYADVLIKFALNSGKGIKKNDVVLLWVRESARPMLEPLQRAVLEAGGHYLTYYVPEGTNRRNNATPWFFDLASDQQINFSPKKYYKGLTDQIDHQVEILSAADPHLFSKTNTKKLMQRELTVKPWMDYRGEKEYAGKFTWTLALFGTPGLAKEANLSEQAYWQQIIQACFLDFPDPIQQWKKVSLENKRIQKALNQLPINKLHLEAKDTDLWITLGKKRKWVGGSGRNIPSFEIYISPDCRYTEGTISFSQPLYTQGNLVRGIRLWFKNGRVVKATADQGEKLLRELVIVKNGDMIGEFSLTDGRMSRITKFMAHTLYDENIGGPLGNTHLALGLSYKNVYTGDPSKLNKTQMKQLGFNDCATHTDIMSTTDRTVTAVLQDGSEKVIYKSGKFII